MAAAFHNELVLPGGDQSMASLADFKAKYATVLETVKACNVRLDHLHVENDKLVMSGGAPSEKMINMVWDAVKAVDPIYADLLCQLSVDASLPEPVRTYTVAAGDSLWKIAQKHYGNGAQVPRIIAANPGKLKDDKSVIHPGDVLNVPED
jgi:nucleoid-associated protein YgaU